MKNTIAFQKGFIIYPEGNNKEVYDVPNMIMAMNVQAELMQFGYMLDQYALQALANYTKDAIKDFHEEIINYLKGMTGGLRNYQPIYKGFPEQVMEMSEFHLWGNQIMGYLTGGSFQADEWTKSKGSAFEHVNYKKIIPIPESGFASIFTDLISVNQSLTPSDMRIVEWFISHYEDLEFPEVIPFKETMCTVIGKCLQAQRTFDDIPKLTTTDLLRIVVYLSGGDVSLPKVPPKNKYVRKFTFRRSTYVPVENPERAAFKFKKFSRPERKAILGLMELVGLNVKEMKLKANRWIRLGEILHPMEYKKEFSNTALAFQILRNDKVTSWYGQVDAAFKQSFSQGIAKLMERPGEFMRRLDYLIRTNLWIGAHLKVIFSSFEYIALKSSNKVLFEVYSYFETRRKNQKQRSIMVKGQRKKVQLTPLTALPTEVVDIVQATIFNALKHKFSTLPHLGNCYIDPELKKIPLPTNMRSLNASLVPIIRGQRTPIDSSKNTIRMFIHWFDEHGTIDLDLHGYLIGDNKIESFGYNGLHRDNTLGCYSGDVRHRQGACAEYVDINISGALRQDYKYFAMIIHNFNGGKLSDIKECVAGIMSREYPEKNSLWVPSSIENSIKVEGSGNNTLVGLVDLTTMEYVHVDLDFNELIDTNEFKTNDTFMNAILPYMELPKVSVYDLIKMHVDARGEESKEEDADIKFMYEDFASSYVKTLQFMGI